MSSEEDHDVIVVESMSHFQHPSPRSRRAFIMKTSGIVLFMLLISTMILMVPFGFHDLRIAIRGMGHFSLLVLLGYLIFTISVGCCCMPLLYRSPCNYIILGTYAIVTGLFLMVVCASYDLYAVIVAMAATMVCVLATIAFAAVCKKDLTSLGYIAMIVGLVLFVVVIGAFIASFFVPPTTMFYVSMALSAVLVLFFMFNLVITIQSVIGGTNKKVVFSEQAYAVAALMIFTDVIGLFLNLLNLTNLAR